MKQQKYLYDPHMHTSPASACARSDGAAMARSYHKAGYSGIIVTDHFFNGNSGIPRHFPWEKRVLAFAASYESARAEGENIGLSVFFGWEYNYHSTEFLTYGLGTDFLLANPDLLKWSPEEYFDRVHEAGGFIVHAHPFREAAYIHKIRLYPDKVDAVETMNAGNQPEYNRRAVEYAEKHGLPAAGGGDCHHENDKKRGGMSFDRRLEDIFDFIDCVKNGAGSVLPL